MSKHESTGIESDTRVSQDAEQPAEDELIAASLAYFDAQKGAFGARLGLFKAEARAGLVRLVAAMFGALAAAVLLFTSWVLAMVGLSGMLADWFATPGVSVLIVAGANALAGGLLFLFARTMLRKTAEVRPFSGFAQ